MVEVRGRKLKPLFEQVRLGFLSIPLFAQWPLIQAISSYNVSWFELKETGQLE